MSESKSWWEINIAFEATQEQAQSLADHIGDNVICQFFGDHDLTADECPLQWTMGLSPVPDEEEE